MGVLANSETGKGRKAYTGCTSRGGVYAVCLPVTRVVYARMPPCYRVGYVLHSQVPGWCMYYTLRYPGGIYTFCYPGGIYTSCYPGGIPFMIPGWAPVHATRVGIPVCTTVGWWVSPWVQRWAGGYPRYVHPGIPWWVYIPPCMLPVCTPGYTSLCLRYHSDYTVVHAGGMTPPWALTLRNPWVRGLGEPPIPPSCYERAVRLRMVTPLFPCERID